MHMVEITHLELFYRLMFLDVLLALQLRQLIRFAIDSTSLCSILCFLILQINTAT